MKKILTLFVVLQTVAICGVKAVPAYPFPVDITQPDGSVLTIRVHGDEHFAYVTTEDGYLLKQNANGVYEYATFVNNSIVSIGVFAKNRRTKKEIKEISGLNKVIPAEQVNSFRSNSPLKAPVRQNLAPNPLYGSHKGLVILVNFTDKAFIKTKANFENLLGQTGYNQNGDTGCAREYFEASTMGAFSPRFDVVGPVTLPHNMAFYGAEQGSSSDVNPRQMIIDACNLVASTVNFADYDTDNDGYVDNVFVYYAGHNQAEGADPNTIWPHRGSISGGYYYNGKQLRDYACTSELKGPSGSSMCGIGTFCHEFSHVLGLPDLYDTASNAYTIGYWDLMCSGPYNNEGRTPPTYSALERFFLGYSADNITVLKTDSMYTLDPITTSNAAYIISPNNDVHNLNGTNPNPSEYFIIENRQAVGWDGAADLKVVYSDRWYYLGTGLLITKVNFKSSDWVYNTVNTNPNSLGVDIIEADGTATVFSMTGDTYPGSTNKTYFAPVLNSGTHYNGDLLNIENVGEGVIAFCYRECSNIPTINLIPQYTNFKTVQGTPSETCIVGVNGTKLSDSITLAFRTGSSYFEMKMPEGTTWLKSIKLGPDTDSIIATSIAIRYNPPVPSYRDSHTGVLRAKTVDASGIPQKELSFAGTSTRAVKVVPPVMEEPTKFASNSFQANWKPVNDATGYYVSAYTANGTEDKTTEKEQFSKFDELASPGWKQNFYTVTSVSVPSAPSAVQFKTVQDTLYSPYYPEAISSIKFWVRCEDMNQHGFFYVEGMDVNGVWDTITTVNVDVALTAQTKTYSNLDNKNYRRLRFSCAAISSRGVAFDDFETTYNAKMAVIRQYVEKADSATVSGLAPLTEYICKVQATDRHVAGSLNEWYENVTDFSSLVTAITLEKRSDDPRELAVSLADDGSLAVTVDPEDRDKDLYVFDIMGKLLRHIPHSEYADTTSKVIIKGLPSGTYVISLGAKRKGKFAKVMIK
ncbi:MAG: M6 family metalloprotease domain-containing protein [Prevotellaceae bacterium]|jgi:M6 family metalloprotease-like protein|nr:M6 family metalloprotease domain-containing protein [Prevotellaceae bacterium]